MRYLSSTHCNLPDEVVRIYGNRWDIKVFFKICKSFLALAREIQMRLYDALIAHTTFVMVRYIFLSVEHRHKMMIVQSVFSSTRAVRRLLT